MRRAAAVMAFLGLGGCVLTGFAIDPPRGGAGGEGDGGAAGALAGSGGAAGGSGGAGCGSRRWPDRDVDAADGEDIDFTVALQRIDHGGEGDAAASTIGYDLDGECGPDGPRSCTRPSFADRPASDGPDGIDNNLARMFGAFSVLESSLTSEGLSAGIAAGEWTILLAVRGYDGTADDPQVSVAILPSPGFRFDPCNGETDVPQWDGTDRWPVHATSLLDDGGDAGGGDGAGGDGAGACVGERDPALNRPRFVDDNAYVANGTLVASLPVAGITLSGGDVPVTITLSSGFITARVEAGERGWTLRDGLLVGRWPSNDVLDAMSNIATANGSLCVGDSLYTELKRAVCGFVDIATNDVPTAVCDAISFAVAFDALPAELGAVHRSTTVPTTCPAGQDPADDTCD